MRIYAVEHPVWGYGYLTPYGYKGGVTYFRFTSKQYGEAIFSTQDIINHNIPVFSVRQGRIKQ